MLSIGLLLLPLLVIIRAAKKKQVTAKAKNRSVFKTSVQAHAEEISPDELKK